MNNLGELLKTLRGNKSLREVAEITELSHTYISDIEKGYRRGSKKTINPSPDTLKRLAEAYDYDYEKLMREAGYLEEAEESDGEFDKWLNDPRSKILFKEFNESSEEQKEALLKMWEILKGQGKL